VILLGLTGGIAMGKSRAAAMVRAHGVPVFDADAVVHALVAPGGAAVAAVDAAFPGCLTPTGGIDRARRGAMVLGDGPALRRLEAILHPAVRAAEGRFLRRACRAGGRTVVLDIPLLFETGRENQFNAVVVVACPRGMQLQRLMERNKLSKDDAERRLNAQLPIEKKVEKATHVIRTDGTFEDTDRQVAELIEKLGAK